ncbi:hypothetical protein HLI_07915 [Halobacillus litoralis]|uniref:Uncharacterized protein n=1 Tax=Halobacillus litoralis TaxID=45668 RepID=A0A410MBU4_9BACI|nr:hypothetical protein HLI_07915 [Halobacillus litoralis]
MEVLKLVGSDQGACAFDSTSSSAYPLEVLSKPFAVAKGRHLKGLLKLVGGDQGACAFDSSSSSAYPLEVLSKPFAVAKDRHFKGLLKLVGGDQGASAFDSRLESIMFTKFYLWNINNSQKYVCIKG